MPEVSISIGGRRYRVSCRPGEEQHLRLLGQRLDARAASVTEQLGTVAEARLLLMTALLVADDLDAAAAAAAEAAPAPAPAPDLEQLAEVLEQLAARAENAGSLGGDGPAAIAADPSPA